MTKSGVPSVRLGNELLDDPVDPVASAVMFANPEQLQGARRVVLFGAGLGYRLLRLKQLGIRDAVVFEPSPEVLDLGKRTLPDAFEDMPVFSDVPPFLAHMLRGALPDERTILLVPPAYRRAFPEVHGRVSATLREAQGIIKVQKNSAEQRGAGMIECALRNLHQLTRVPNALSLGKPLAGCPAFIVSAGPSLDRNAHLLPEAAKKGAIFAVNTSAPVVTATGALIDALVTIESLQATSALEASAAGSRTLALDITANPEGYEVDVASRLCFAPRVKGFSSLGTGLDMPLLPYGASVATAAFSLAFHWGADPIVVLGQDLAYTDSRAYAKGTPHASIEVRIHPHAIEIRRSEEQIANFTRGGLKPPPKLQPRVQVPAWGGGLVNTTVDLCLFRRWFEGTAYSSQGHRFINATEGGAHIDGFEDIALATLLESMASRNDTLAESIAAARPLPEARVEAFRKNVIDRARVVERAAERCLAARSKAAVGRANEALKEVVTHSPLSSTHAESELLPIMSNTTLSMDERARLTFEAIRRSARRVAEICTRDPKQEGQQ